MRVFESRGKGLYGDIMGGMVCVCIYIYMYDDEYPATSFFPYGIKPSRILHIFGIGV